MTTPTKADADKLRAAINLITATDYWLFEASEDPDYWVNHAVRGLRQALEGNHWT